METHHEVSIYELSLSGVFGVWRKSREGLDYFLGKIIEPRIFWSSSSQPFPFSISALVAYGTTGQASNDAHCITLPHFLDNLPVRFQSATCFRMRHSGTWGLAWFSGFWAENVNSVECSMPSMSASIDVIGEEGWQNWWFDELLYAHAKI